MIHFSKVEWGDYVNNRLTSAGRELLDEHLYSCDRCLSVYMSCVEEQAEKARMKAEEAFVTNEETFTEMVFQTIKDRKKESLKPPFYQRAFFHYGVAAVLTIILMSSGMFQDVFAYVANFDHASGQSPPVSGELMERAVAIIDAFNKK